MSVVFFNGEYLEENEAKVSINDSGYYYGDGFYEVIYLRNGKLIDKELHFDRLMGNFQKLYFKNYPSKKDITTAVREVIMKNNNCQNGAVYLQFTRGCTPRTHEFAELNLIPSSLIKINEISNNCFSSEIPKWNCCVVRDPRRMHCDIKMISLLPMVLAKYEAEKNGFDDVIFYNDRCASITEGSSYNVFIIDQSDKIITCPTGNQLLPGCTRARIIKIIQENNYDFEERFFSKEELYSAKEVFLTASLKINAITKVNGNVINDGDVGKTTQEIRNKYLEFMDEYKDE